MTIHVSQLGDPPDLFPALGAGEAPGVGELICDADVILALGTELGPTDFWGALPSRAQVNGWLIRVDLDPETNIPPQIEAVGNMIGFIDPRDVAFAGPTFGVWMVLMAILGGKGTLDDLIEDAGSGLLVTGLIGVGANIVNGNYSRGAAGFWFEGGEITGPVNEVTIAGQLPEMFRSALFADDAPGLYAVDAPSIALPGMTIGGR